MMITYDCVVCGARVTKSRSPKNLHGKQPQYCSQRCNGAARLGTGSGTRPNVEFSCVACGKAVRTYRSPSSQAVYTPKYCSLTCTGAAQSGDGNPSFSGGKHHDANGYVRVLRPEHPNSDPRGYVLEHRLVMEEELGRLLGPNEVVHHRNEVRDDNRPENLELFASHSDHMRIAHAPS